MKDSIHKCACAVMVLTYQLLIPSQAQAEIKHFAFQGTITWVENLSFLLDESVTNGAAFKGFYTFDSNTKDSNPDPTVGDYWHTNGNFGIVVSVGNYVFRTDPWHTQFLVEVVNRFGEDGYLLRSYHNVCSKPINVEHISWQLDDATGRAISSDHLPITPPVLPAWKSISRLNVIGGCQECEAFFIRGVVQSISETPVTVPEPPSSTVSDAVEVKWLSQVGYYYQVQTSEKHETWTDVGEPILGDGTILSRFFPRPHGPRTAYRVEVRDSTSTK